MDLSSRLPLVEAAKEGVREILTKVQGTEAGYFDEQKFSEVGLRRQLAESNVDSKVDAMKRVLAAQSCGRDVSRLFPEVVNNASVPNIELKKLVQLYLVANADSNRDVALLAVNSFQKDLTDRNQLVRASALRGMTSMKVLEMMQIVMTAMRKSCVDSSPYVRKTAAHCIPKLLASDVDQFAVLRDLNVRLLGDIESSVVGAAIVSFSLICITSPPEDVPKASMSKFVKQNLALLHPSFRKLCHFLPRLEAWPQAVAADVLLRYCRQFFVSTAEILPAAVMHAADDVAAHLASSSRQSGSQARNAVVAGKAANPPNAADLFSDLKLFLDSLTLLLRSTKAGVVTAASTAILELLPLDDFPPVARGATDTASHVEATGSFKGLKTYEMKQQPSANTSASGRQQQSVSEAVAIFNRLYVERVFSAVIRCLSVCSEDILETLLKIVYRAILVVPDLAKRHIAEFFVQHSDPLAVKIQKLSLLTGLCDASNAPLILRELKSYLHMPGSTEFTGLVFKAITSVALRLPAMTDGVLRGLITMLDCSSPLLASEAVVAVRTLLQQRSRSLQSDAGKGGVGGGPVSGGQQPWMLAPIVTHLVGYLLGGDDTSSAAGRRDSRAEEGGVLKAPAARASVVWIIGRYHNAPDVPTFLAPDVLRILAKGFAFEPVEVKLQILALSAKLWGFHFLNKLRSTDSAISVPGGHGRELPPPQISEDIFPRIDEIVKYVVDKCMSSSDPDLLDRARAYRVVMREVEALRSSGSSAAGGAEFSSFCVKYLQVACQFVDSDSDGECKSIVTSLSRKSAQSKWTMNSLANVTSEPLRGYLPLQPFCSNLSEVPTSSIRDTVASASHAAAGVTSASSQSVTQSRQQFRNDLVPEEPVPTRKTNIPKLEKIDDLDDFYSKLPPSAVWDSGAAGNSAAAKMSEQRAVPPAAKASPFDFWDDDEGLPKASSTPQVQLPGGSGEDGRERTNRRALGSAVLGEDSESEEEAP